MQPNTDIDMRQDGLWENRNTYTYYAELVLELAALSVEFLHHVHMLVSYFTLSFSLFALFSFLLDLCVDTEWLGLT